MTKIALLILIFTCFSCTKKEKLIEIYLPKYHIEFQKGERITKHPKILKQYQDWFGADFIDTTIVRVTDSVTLFAGEFSAKTSDLKSEPFISANEILGFNPNTNELVLTESAISKISSLKHRPRYSNQFVITYDKKPILNAYFNNSMTSQYVYAPQILYMPNVRFNGKARKTKKQELIIRNYKIGQGFKKFKNDSLALYFKKSNKIIE